MLIHRGGFRHYNREILKFMKNFLARMTGRVRKIEREVVGKEQRKKLTEQETK